jgi:hypothetical protein
VRVEDPNEFVIGYFLQLYPQLLSNFLCPIQMLALVLRHLFALFNQFDHTLRFDAEQLLEFFMFWLRASLGMHYVLFINSQKVLLGRYSLEPCARPHPLVVLKNKTLFRVLLLQRGIKGVLSFCGHGLGFDLQLIPRRNLRFILCLILEDTLDGEAERVACRLFGGKLGH